MLHRKFTLWHHSHFGNCDISILLITRLHRPVACLSGCTSIGSEWTETGQLDEKLGGHNWYQGLDCKTWTTIINNSSASMIKSYTFKIFIAQLGTLNNLQNARVHPPFPAVCSCSYPMAHLYFFAVTMRHLGAVWSQSWSSVDLCHISEAPWSPAISAMVISCLGVPELWAKHRTEFVRPFYVLPFPKHNYFPVKTQILVWD